MVGSRDTYSTTACEAALAVVITTLATTIRQNTAPLIVETNFDLNVSQQPDLVISPLRERTIQVPPFRVPTPLSMELTEISRNF